VKQKYSLRGGARPNEWYKLPSEEAYRYVKRATTYVPVESIVAQIFTIDEAIIRLILSTTTYIEFTKKFHKKEGEG
jgi:hypothetical protein